LKDAVGTGSEARASILGTESASSPKGKNGHLSNPLRWKRSVGEDMLGFRRQKPSGLSFKDPKVQGNQGRKGRKVSQ
jgi:hypothetical protein